MKKCIVTLAISTVLSLPVLANTEVSIAGWGGNDVVVFNKLINEVLVEEIKNSELTIKYQVVEGDFSQYITNALSAGTAPDAFYIDIVNAKMLNQSGKVLPNSDKLNLIATELLPNLNQAFTFDDKQFGLPKDFNTIALVFNEDLFEEANVDTPNDSDTWDTLREKLIQVKDNLGGDITGLCVMPDYARFAVFPLSTGWKPFNADGKTVLDDNFRRAFEFYTNLVTKDKVAILPSDLGQDWGGGCLGTEKAAITFEGNWISGYLRDKAPNLPYGSTFTPKDPQTGGRGNLLFTVSWGVNADGKNVEATEKAIELLTSEKAQKWVLDSGLALPSRLSLANSEYFSKPEKENQLSKIIFDSASNGNVMPYAFSSYGFAWMDPINQALSSVMLGQATVDEALAQAQKAYDDMMK